MDIIIDFQETISQFKQKIPSLRTGFFYALIITLVAVLAGSLGLLATLDAGALIALATTHFSHDTGLGAASLETLQGAIQALAFLDMNFGHLFFPSLRCTRLFPGHSLRAI